MVYHYSSGVLVPFTKKYSKQIILAIASIFIATVAAMSLTTNAAPTSIVVSPSNLNGWNVDIYTQPGGSDSFVPAADAPIGVGALQLTTNSDPEAFTRRGVSVNVPLADVAQLSYMTKQLAAADIANGNATLRVSIDYTGDGVKDDSLMYEPYYNGFNGTTMAGWQTWNVKEGKFWSNSGNSYNGFDCGGNAGGSACNFTLVDVLKDYPSAKVVRLYLSMGTYNRSQQILADKVQINDTIYDFEADVVLANKDACKKNGWTASTLPVFKNQGDCVSHFASNGKAKGNPVN